MQSTKPTRYLIDFDSTFIQSEGLDVLAELSLEKHSDKESIVNQIKYLTQQGMEGKISFAESLRERVALLQTNRQLIKQAAQILKKHISPSIQRNKAFFQEHKNQIYIISGGFHELIQPVVKSFGIPPKHIFANTFTYNDKGAVIGIDTKNLMSRDQGKVKVVRSLKLANDLYIIGDGYTDYELKKLGFAKKFIAFTENIIRDNVVKNADYIVPNFDEFLFVNKLPRSFSYPKNRITVVVNTTVPKADLELLKNEGYQFLKASDSENASILLTDKKNEHLLVNIHKALAIGFYGNTKPVLNSTLQTKGIAVFHKKSIARNIIAYINTGSTSQSTNIPNLSLAQYKHSHRLLHIHENTPGMLAQINNVLSEHKINILGQYLKTNTEIGYVIIDVDKKYDRKVLSVLKRIPHTIRFRVLY